jgi:hypothetical protein
MTSPTRAFLAATFAIGFASVVSAQHSAMPAGMTHEQHMAQMKKDAEMKQRGNVAMGFDQDKTTHHFTMSAAGGAIAVSVNDPSDQASLRQVRATSRRLPSRSSKATSESRSPPTASFLPVCRCCNV